MVVEKEAALEEPPKENIAEMHQEYEDFKRTKGESHPYTVLAKKLADAARTRRDDAKSLDQLEKEAQRAKQQAADKIKKLEAEEKAIQEIIHMEQPIVNTFENFLTLEARDEIGPISLKDSGTIIAV